MKSKYLKTYENYKTGYLNDNKFFNESEEENTENGENTEDKVETDVEEVETESENTEDSVEIEVKVKTGDASEQSEETDSSASASGVIAICSKPEIDMPISTGFNPSDNFSTTAKAEWCIIKCMTNNGERLGIDKQSETDCEIVCGGLHYEDAVTKVEEFTRKCNCQAFDNDCDVYLGKISKYFIKKPVKSSGGFDGIGSYK